MTSVITGDIIKSRGIGDPQKWLIPLKNALHYLEPNTKYWEIYRGDSFQIEIRDPSEAFEAATYLKACIKMIKGLDVRLAIGIGEKTFEGEKVTESNGQAFQFSGDTLESLKKEKLNLKIKSKNVQSDTQLNLYFKLVLIAMDHWTVNSAEIVKLAMENPEALQKELGDLIGINQNAVSQRQKRAYLDHILELNTQFKQINKTL